MAEKQTGLTPAREERLSRREPMDWPGSPFRLFRRLTEEMDRMFDDFRLGRPTSWGSGFMRGWSPEIEVFQKNNELTIRADVPGLKRDDIAVEVTDDAVTIQGERKHEQEEEREGVYRSERAYGSFYRTIPLPEGAMSDQARAQVRDGVLEITMPMPPAPKAKRLEISEGRK